MALDHENTHRSTARVLFLGLCGCHCVLWLLILFDLGAPDTCGAGTWRYLDLVLLVCVSQEQPARSLHVSLL